MSSLPKFTWDQSPIFYQIPQEFVIGVAGLIAAYSVIQGLRRKGGDHYSTAALFGVLAFVAWKYMESGLELRYYSLLFVGVFLGGYSLLKWQIVRGGGPASDAGDFIVYGVLGVLVGARLGHVLFYDLDKALKDPAWIFKIWTGGLASHGAVLGLILAMFVFTKRRGIPFLEGADRFAFSAALGATLVRIGNWMNSEIVGRVVPGQTWGVAFPRYAEDRHRLVEEGVAIPYRYPTQLAEISLGFLVLLALYLVDRKLGRENRPRGALISTFFAVYFSGRFFIEFYKEFEGPITAGSPVTMGQVLSLPGVLLGFYGLYWALTRKVPAGWPNPDEYEEEDDVASRRGQRDDDDDDTDDEDDDDEKSRPDAARKRRDDEDDEDDTADDDDTDDDDVTDSERARAENSKPKPAAVDPDIEAEFDEKGALKRQRGQD
jgi:phosphatidylglycerol:prolipoprotein diacylglycerol transferase